jgi:CubicO group peptidase (beta-lactamase class C family)
VTACRWVVAVALCAACRATLPTPESAGVPVASPATLGFDSAALARVANYVASQVDSAYPGAVVAVGRHGRLALLSAAGHYGTTDPRPVDPTTVYDLASLTKVIGLTTACMILVNAGSLDLDAPVQRYLPEFRGPGKDRVTIRHLLTHSSGLPAWRPLFREARDRRTVLALVDTTPLDTVPGARFVYSDLGAIVLMQVVERITGERIDHYLERVVFGPLDMPATRYLPPRSWRARIAPTEIDTVFRHRLIRGEVHDENAGRMGGVSGHAGLFSNALDLARFADWLLESARRDDPAADSSARRTGAPPAPCGVLCFRPGVVAEFVHRQEIPPGSTRALGWDTPSDSGYSSAGSKLSRRSFGHTGFTGTSIWMDPDRDLFLVLLTNRVNPTRANTKLLHVRAVVADLVAAAVVAP